MNPPDPPLADWLGRRRTPKVSIIRNIISILTGKKTIVKFSAGDYDIRLSFLGKVNNAPADFDHERMNAALKEALQTALAQFVADQRTIQGRK